MVGLLQSGSQVCKKNELEPIFCEIGAGNGRFAYAFLQEWEESIKTPFTYMIVESSAYHLGVTI